MWQIRRLLRVFHLVLQKYRQKKPNKYFVISFFLSFSLFALFAALLFFTDADIFVWFMHITLYATAIIGVVGFIWEILNVVKQLEQENSL